MNFKIDWHPHTTAAQWPRGSAVVVRALKRDNTQYTYEYWLAECFFPSFVDERNEYLLLESPKEHNVEMVKTKSTAQIVRQEG